MNRGSLLGILALSLIVGELYPAAIGNIIVALATAAGLGALLAATFGKPGNPLGFAILGLGSAGGILLIYKLQEIFPLIPHVMWVAR